MDVVTSDETYHFVCRRCRHEWEQEYQVRRWVDSNGQEYVACRIAGSPTVPPWSGTICPQCGGYRVVLLPHRDRHDTGAAG